MKIFAMARAATAALAIGLAAPNAWAQEQALRMGTSSTGSVYYTLAVAISKLLKEHGGISSTVEPVGGSTPNVFAIGSDRVDIAITNSMASYDGFHGLGRFKKPLDVKLLVVGNPSLRQLIIRKGSGVKEPADIVGKTFIGKRPALPELEMITNAFFKVYGIDATKVRVIATTETNEAMDAFASGTVDAGIIPGSAGAGYFQKASRDGTIEFYPMPEAKVDEMLKILPKSVDKEMVPAKTYPGQEQPYWAFDMATTFVASGARVSEETGYKVVKAIFDHTDEFKTYHSAARDWTLEKTLRQAKIPFHPGLVRYLKEKKLWTDELAARQAQLAKP
ncbi:MAG TPA: TAXI family TRAP transporter solute-binding subunit [Beijerinckiaceae bacterium]|jgi:TRAP transporter TAXI family solute receptor